MFVVLVFFLIEKVFNGLFLFQSTNLQKIFTVYNSGQQLSDGKKLNVTGEKKSHSRIQKNMLIL